MKQKIPEENNTNGTEYYLSGSARCLQCNYEWVAVSPIGTR